MIQGGKLIKLYLKTFASWDGGLLRVQKKFPS